MIELARMKRWTDLIDVIKNQVGSGCTTVDRLFILNRFINNNVIYMTEEKDVWSTPIETLNRGFGDCEDYALAKYVTAYLAGLDTNNLRLTYLLLPGRIGHMSLIYHNDGKSYILDSRNDVLDSLDEHKDWHVIYAFNHSALWIGNNPNPVSSKPEDALKQWKDFVQRCREQEIPIWK